MVVNPHAGGSGEDLVHAVIEACAEQSMDVRRLNTDAPGSAVRQVAQAVHESAPGIVVAVGGDGTVREVAEGVARASGRWTGSEPAGSPPAVLVVPAGSGNSAYSLLWGELPWRDAVASALGSRRRVRHADLIRVREAGRAAFLGVNFGLVALVARVIERMKAQGGRDQSAEQRYWAALGEVLQDLLPFPVRVTVDGEPLHEGLSSMITVGGVRSFGRGMFKLLPRSVIDDGLLDVCIVEAQTAEEIGALASLVPTGDHVGEPGVLYAQGRSVTVERMDGEPLSMEHDGDPRDADAAVTLEVVPGVVRFAAAADSATERG